MITLEDIKKNEEVQELILSAQKQMKAIGYTEHSVRHVSIVSNRAGKILETLGYPKERVELAKIAGYMHDIGNCVNRVDHAHSGAILAYQILKDMNMSTFDKHDKVNYAVTNSEFKIDSENKIVTLDLTIDTNICPVLDYFEIFMDRTMMSKYAAKFLNIWFELVINGTKLL